MTELRLYRVTVLVDLDMCVLAANAIDAERTAIRSIAHELEHEPREVYAHHISAIKDAADIPRDWADRFPYVSRDDRQFLHDPRSVEEMVTDAKGRT